MDANIFLRSEYSFNAGYLPLEPMLVKLQAQGCKVAGLVDTTTWGHVPFFNGCKERGISPLLGASIAITPDGSDGSMRPQMSFIARNTQGLSELYEFMHLAYEQSIIGRAAQVPRLYCRDVLKMSENIIKFVGGCITRPYSAMVNELLKQSTFWVNSDLGNWYTNEATLPLAEKAQGRFVFLGNASPVCIESADMDAMEFLPCGMGLKGLTCQVKCFNDPKQDYIIDMCSELELPRAPTIHLGKEPNARLRDLCYQGLIQRGLDGKPEYRERLEHELSEIEAKDFSSYFLMVHALVRWAKEEQGILVGPSRGSAAGSLVCYVLHITEIDPLPPRLYFERFIDKSRKDLPDIDLDFPDNTRDAVFEYLREKYGAENVAHVGAVLTFGAKSTLVHCCKKSNVPPLVSFPVKTLLDANPDATLQDVFNTEQGRTFVETVAGGRLATVMTKIEGLAKTSGTHAAGALVCNEPLTKFCTIDNNGVAQVDKRNLEQLNLLKIDVLGLRTLTILADCGIDVDWYSLPLNDPATLQVFNSGKLCGVFQFEGAAMRSVAKQITFKDINDIDAVTALARPGPMDSGLTEEWLARRKGKAWTAFAPCFNSFSYGLPLYQENTMQIVRELGDFDWVETSRVRKAISKSQGAAALQDLQDKFITNAQGHGLTEAQAQGIWSQVTAMGAWQMNKAHTYSYAVVSYWTAWLKAHYPLYFMAATLNHLKDKESALALLREFCAEGYSYTYFDPRKSLEQWSVQGGMLYGGFTVLEGVGLAKAQILVAKRTAGNLLPSEIEALQAMPSAFKDLSPLRTLYRKYYENPDLVRGGVQLLGDVGDPAPEKEMTFICTIVNKVVKDANDPVQVAKRQGQKIPAGKPTIFVDFKLKDDTGTIIARVGRTQVPSFNLDRYTVGSDILVRMFFFKGRRFGFIRKMRLLRSDWSAELC